ncbi:MAG: CsgG/HfaB family protein, partial [Acidobacteria bacterium]|nr:CsgG/HfaB family protein [Acidobacteriota bacterium]
MHRSVVLFAVLSLAGGSLVAETHAGLKRRVAVMDMAVTATTLSTQSPGSYSQTTSMQIPPPADFALGLTEMLTTELMRTGRFIVLERQGIADITAEQDLGAGERANAETAVTAGGIVGAQALIRCAVTEYSYAQS